MSRWNIVFTVAACAIGGLLGSSSPAVPGPENSQIGERLALRGHEAVNTGVQVASQGTTVAIVWTTRASGASAGDIMLAVSEDGGHTFGLLGRVNDGTGRAEVGGEQPPHVVIGPAGDLYVVWRVAREHDNRIVAAHSSDLGQTFSSPQPVHDVSKTAFRGFQSAAVAPDGALHVTWLDGRHADGPKRHAHHAPRQDIYHAAWKPGSQPSEAQIRTDVCFCCKTATAVSDAGEVLLAWRDIYERSLRDIAFSRGQNDIFSAPVRVSEDGWQLDGCPDDGPALRVAAESVHVVWPTVVDRPTPAKRVFHASSVAGKPFGPRTMIHGLGGKTMSHPQLGVFDDGGLVVVWDELEAGQRDIALAYAPAGRTVGAARFHASMKLNETSPASYPAVAVVPGGALIAWTSGRLDTETVVAYRRVTLP